MCVIIHKPAGVEVDEHILWQCQTYNNDGCGYVASTPKGKVFLNKGFVDDVNMVVALEEDCEAMGYDMDEMEIIFHFRIATAGAVNMVNTHPFIIHKEKVNMNVASGLRHQVIAHNGHVSIPDVFGVDSDKLKVYSDSYLLARDVLSHMDTSLRFRVLRQLAKTNRFAIMMPSGKVRRFGSWEYEDKMWFSNTWWKYYSRKPYKSSYTPYSWGGQKYYGGDDNKTTATTGKAEKNYTVPDPECYHSMTLLDENNHIICDDCGGNLSLYCTHDYIYGEDGQDTEYAGVCSICYEQVGVPSEDPSKCEHPRARWMEGLDGVWYNECPDCFDTLQVVYMDKEEARAKGLLTDGN